MGCTDIAIIEQPALPAELTTTLELAANFARASKAKATQEAYRSDFRIFESWCRSRGLSALPATAESLCAFLADEGSAGRRASTLFRRLAAIRYFHRAAGLPWLRSVDLRRPQPARGLRDERGEARGEPDQDHGCHRAQVARDAQDLQPRRGSIRRSRRRGTALNDAYRHMQKSGRD